MGFWSLLKAIAKFGMAMFSGFEIADLLQKQKAEAELKRQWENLKNELKTFKFDGFDDAKVLLLIVLCILVFMLLVWLFSTIKSCMGKFFKKSVQDAKNW